MTFTTARSIQPEAGRGRRGAFMVAVVVAGTMMAGLMSASPAAAADPTPEELAAASDLAFSYTDLWAEQAKARALVTRANGSSVAARSLLKTNDRTSFAKTTKNLAAAGAKLAYPATLTNEVVEAKTLEVSTLRTSLKTLTSSTETALTTLGKKANARAEVVRKNVKKATKTQRKLIQTREKALTSAIKSHSSSVKTRFSQLVSATNAAEKKHKRRGGRATPAIDNTGTPTPPPSAGYTDAKAQKAVEDAWGAVPLPTDSGSCIYRNYGTWSSNSTPPPPMSVSVGLYIAYTAHAVGDSGSVQYYACPVD